MIKIGEIIQIEDEINFFYKIDSRFFYSVTTNGLIRTFPIETYSRKNFQHTSYNFYQIFTKKLLNKLCDELDKSYSYYISYDGWIPLIEEKGIVLYYNQRYETDKIIYKIDNGFIKMYKNERLKTLDFSDIVYFVKKISSEIKKINFTLFEHKEFVDVYNTFINLKSSYSYKKDIISYYLKSVINDSNVKDFVKAFEIHERELDFATPLFYCLELKKMYTSIELLINLYPQFKEVYRKVLVALKKEPEKRSKVAKINTLLISRNNYEILKEFENNVNVEYDLINIFESILNQVNEEELSKEIVDIIINIINKNRLYYTDYSFLLKKLGDNKLHFINSIPNLKVYPEYGEYLSVGKKIKLFRTNQIGEIDKFIRDNISELITKNNVGDLVCFLIDNYHIFRYHPQFGSPEFYFVDNLPWSKLLKIFLCNYESYYDCCIKEEIECFERNEKDIISKDYFHSLKGISDEEIKQVETYFDLTYKYNENEVSFDLLFQDYNHQHVIFEYNYNARKQKLAIRDNYYNYVKRFDITIFLRYAKYKLGSQLYEGLNAIENYFENKDKIESQISFNAAIRELTSTIEQDDKNLVFEKVKIVPSYYKNKTIEFKIGRNKYYLIKLLWRFVKEIENQVEVKYGKDLTFDNNIDGFNDASKKIIDFIKINCDNCDRNSTIEHEKLVELVDISKGQDFFIDSELYKVSNDDIDFKIRINEEGCLSVDLKEGYSLYDGLAVNKEEGIIKNLNCDKTLKKFCHIIENNGLASVLGALDEFKYNIYLKYANYFIIDDEMKDKFFFNDVVIKSYFDLDMGKILVKTKLFQNDNEITSDILSNYSLKQYARYKKLLDAYGFVDNEIIDQNSIVNFLLSDLSQLKELSNVYFSESIKNKKINNFEAPKITINRQGSLAECFVDDSIYSDDELKLILKSIKKKKKYILLSGNNFIILDDAKSKEFYEMVEDFGLNQEHIHEQRKMPLYMAFKASKYENSINIDDFIKQLIKSIKCFKNNEFILPKGMNANLREYQENGVKWLKILTDNNLGGILADDMGLGKTLEIITLFNSYKRNKPSLIICPKSLIYNWKSEFEKFASKNKVIPIYGLESERKDTIKNIDNTSDDIYITGYESFRIDKDAYQEKEFMFAVLDEAQYIKNVNAQKTKSVKLINADHKFALTGTPIENTIIDLWSIFDFIMPGYLELLSEFKTNYESDSEYSFSIYKKVSPFILRRKKNDVLKDLPEKYDVVITCDMKEEQRKLYEAVRMETKNILEKEGRKGVFSILQSLMRLRQICVDPNTYIDNYTGGSGKMEYLRKLIKEYINSGHRLLIFSQFVTALNEVARYLKEKRIGYLMITGDTKAEARVQMSKDFNESDEYSIMLVSLKAGGNGLNLVGADTVIHLDPWWNSATMEQATDRAYRIGQIRNVEVIRLICENSIEQRVVELQNKKKELFDKVISSDESSIEALTSEDIGYILS